VLGASSVLPEGTKQIKSKRHVLDAWLDNIKVRRSSSPVLFVHKALPTAGRAVMVMNLGGAKLATTAASVLAASTRTSQARLPAFNAAPEGTVLKALGRPRHAVIVQLVSMLLSMHPVTALPV
jgi:hypothetical protein